MKKLLLMIAASAFALSAVQGQNLVSSPDYSILDNEWEGYDSVLTVINPSSFVTATAGVATVTPATANEVNFYQGFGAGPAGNPALTIGQAYEFSIVSSNSSLVGATSAVMFVKAFDGGWGFLAGEFQTVSLAFDGSTQSINFTPLAGAIYQVGTYTIGATGGSYDLTSPSLIAVPEPSTFALLGGLAALGIVIYRRRK